MGHKQSVESPDTTAMPTATDIVSDPPIKQELDDTNDTNLTSGAEDVSQQPTDHSHNGNGGISDAGTSDTDGGRRPKRSATLRPLSTQSALIRKEEEDLKKAIQASLQEAKKARARVRALEGGQHSDNSLSQASSSTKPNGKRAKGSLSSASSTASTDIAGRGKLSAQQRKFAHDSPNQTGHRTPIRKSSIPKPTTEVFPAIRPQPDEFLTYLCFRPLKEKLPPHLDLEAKNRQALLERRKREEARRNSPLYTRFLPSPASSSHDGSARKSNQPKTTANASVTRKLSLDSIMPSKQPKKLSPHKSEGGTLKSNPFTKNIVEKAKKFKTNTSSVFDKSEPKTVAERLRAAATFNNPPKKSSTPTPATINQSSNSNSKSLKPTTSSPSVYKSSSSSPATMASTSKQNKVRPIPIIVFPKLPDTGRSMRNSTRTITLATNNFAAARELVNTQPKQPQSPSTFASASIPSSKPTPPKKPKLTVSKSAPTTPVKRQSRSGSSTSGKSQEDIESERNKIHQLILEIERQHELERRQPLKKPSTLKRLADDSSSDSDSSDTEDEKIMKPPVKKATTANHNGNSVKQANHKPRESLKKSNSTVERKRSLPANHISSTSKPKASTSTVNHQDSTTNQNSSGRSVRSSTKTITLATNNLARTMVSNNKPNARRTTR